MTFSDVHSHFSSPWTGSRVYDPDILPRLQALLATLADLDVDHARNVSAIVSRQIDTAGKDRLIADLRKSHRERRLPYVREIEALRARMEASFG